MVSGESGISPNKKRPDAGLASKRIMFAESSEFADIEPATGGCFAA
jgi:hypothetical protein